MSRFYGSLHGARGEATRQGTAASGIIAHPRGWDLGVRVTGMPASGVDADAEDGPKADRDAFVVDITNGSNGLTIEKHGVLIVSEKPHGVRRIFVDVGPITGVIYLHPDGTWSSREDPETSGARYDTRGNVAECRCGHLMHAGRCPGWANCGCEEGAA